MSSFPPSIRVCFVGLYAYSLFNRKTKHRFGGAELRAYLFSTGLARTGRFDVSFVVMDHGQKPVETFDGVKVYAHSGYNWRWPTRLIRRLFRGVEAKDKAMVRTSRFPYFRLTTFNPFLLFGWSVLRIYWRLGKLIQRAAGPTLEADKHVVERTKVAVYDTVDADMYCVLGATTLASEVAAYCRSHGKQFVLFVASAANLDERYQRGAEGVNAFGDNFSVVRFSLDSADLIVVQSEVQRQLLQARFGRTAILIRNPIAVPTVEASTAAEPVRTFALWIGRADRGIKRPLELLRLARACPDIAFVMIMNPSDATVEREVRSQLTENITFHELMPYVELDQLFDRAFVLVNTSSYEGFPNTYLQAGLHGVPLLSLTVDPDNYITDNCCGVVAQGDFKLLVAGLRRLHSDMEYRRQMGRNNRAYVERYHSLDERISELGVALQLLDAGPLTGGAALACDVARPQQFTMEREA